MRTFRRFLTSRAGRLVNAAVIVASLHMAADPANYVYAVQVQQEKDARVRQIAQNLGIDPEFLLNPGGHKRFDFASLFAWASAKAGLTAAPATATADTNITDSIAKVKQRYALVAADATMTKLVHLLQADTRNNNDQKTRALQEEAAAVARLLDKDLLPPLPDSAPGAARSRHGQMQSALEHLRNAAKPILRNPHALEKANIKSTLAQLKNSVGSLVTITHPGNRWTRDPFPLKDTYKKAPIKTASGPTYGQTAGTSAVLVPVSTSSRRATTTAVAPAVAALATTLGTPAKVFAYVHDTIDWESYSGVAKGALGTLSEKRGNDWDQAVLLRDLLTAQGWQAQIEYGRVTLPIAQAMNLVGTEDPIQAANLLATAGLDGVVLTSGSTPIAIQMTHAWVRALIPYIPNRGATGGTADTWVRMDPSFKRYDYQPGIAINGRVQWSEDEYLRTSAVRAPADFYGDKIWNFIRTNNLNCQNLAQVAKSGSVHAEQFPFVPATLTARIDQVLGVAADPPAAQVQSVTFTLSDSTNLPIATYSANTADLWGRKLTLTFAPATSDDAAIIQSYGDLFSTPAYLIRLKPVFSIDDTPVGEGAPVAAGAALGLNVAFHQPNVADEATHHDVIAGETHTEVLDPGNLPDSLVAQRIERLKVLTNSDAILSEQLYLVGLRYLQHADDGVTFAAGMRWQRAVKRTFEADVRRELRVEYNVAGAPLRLTPAENNIDVSRLAVGIVPINNDLTNRSEALALAGLQSSYLEGAIWEEMQQQQGISATKALLLSRMAGQTLYTANASNIDAVLASVNLPDDVEDEIRGAVLQGRVAKFAASPITLNKWSGTGYILEDPATGAATYPISGGLAGGSTTGEDTAGIKELLGSEPWLEGSPLGDLLRQLLALLGGGGGGSDGPSTTQSDPVNLSSGNMYRTATDISVVARGIPVAVTRTYNSRSTYDGPFGYGWTFNYGEQLIASPDGSMTYREADGTEHLFARNADGTFVSPAGKHLDLESSGSGYTLRFKDGMQFAFNAQGQLSAQTDLNGNTVTINHDLSGNITTIVDATGRTVLTFAVTNGRITTVTDLAGRTVSYGYAGSDLVSVTDPTRKVWTIGYDLAHNLTSFADPLGNTQTYDYDSDDRLFHHVDANGAEEFFHYDIAGRESVLTDRRTGDHFIQYDDSGRALLEADPAGNVVKASFDADNNRTSVIDSRGNTSAYEYDGSGNVTRQTAPDGGVTTTTYDATSRPLTTTDAAGTVTTNSYDNDGNLLTSSKTVGGVTEVTTNTYDTNGQLLSTKDANGATSSMTWNDNGTLATRTDAANNTTTMTTDPLGRITQIKDPGTNVTTLTYDDKDRIKTMTDPYNNTTSFAYDDAGRRTSVTTPRGTTTYAYDGEGRVLSVRDPLGNTTKTSYNAAGDVLTRTDARGNVTRYEYDNAGRATKTTDANGAVWQYGYCAGLKDNCQITDPNGNTIKQTFDVMGRVASVTDSLNHAMYTEYDKLGRKTVQTDANGNATRYGYDESGRLTSVTEANGSITRYTYDKNGNKLTQKDANGHIWSYQYDALNRLLKETDPLSRSTSYTYDALGNLATKTDGKNQTTTYVYTIRRLTKILYADGTTDNFGYDALGRRTSMSNANNAVVTYGYDTLNRVTTMTVSNMTITNPAIDSTAPVTVSYGYDAAGNRVSMTTPRGKIDYTYDGKNRMTRIADPVTGTFSFAYDSMDRRTELDYPNGVKTTYGYDNAYRLTKLATTNRSGAVLDAWSYEYDAVGNRTSKTDMNGTREAYTYDNIDRLTNVSVGAASYESFTYDAVGNRLTRTSTTGTTGYTYDAANQMLTAGGETYTYDGNGNLTLKSVPNVGNTTLTYDAAQRVTNIASPTGTELNNYYADGRRAYMNGPSVEPGIAYVRLIYDTVGNPIMDWAGDGDVWTYRTYGTGIDECLAEYRRISNGRITYQHHDALGSVTVVTDVNGNVAYRSSYTAFGSMSRTGYDVPTTRMGYTGRELSVGGLMQYRSRYYDSNTGRFAQQDSYEGTAGNPPSLHRYAYTLNNPVNYTDPTGHTVEQIQKTLTWLRNHRTWGYLLQKYEDVAEISWDKDLGSAAGATNAAMFGGYIIAAWVHLDRSFATEDLDDAHMGALAGIIVHEFLHLWVAEIAAEAWYRQGHEIASFFSFYVLKLVFGVLDLSQNVFGLGPGEEAIMGEAVNSVATEYTDYVYNEYRRSQK